VVLDEIEGLPLPGQALTKLEIKKFTRQRSLGSQDDADAHAFPQAVLP
jgi:hypothetical protein